MSTRARAIILLLFAPACLAAPATQPATPTDAEITALVSRLTAGDVDARNDATKQLEAFGPRARPALITALNGNDPKAREAVIPILLRMPFDRPQDPDDVRALLKDYGRADVAVRKAVVTRLLVQSPQSALGVLLRLVREDPSNDVRWACLTQLRRLPNAAVTPDMTPADINRPPNLALAGWAWERRDANMAVALLERCIELENRQPTNEPEIVLVFYDLAVQYAARRRYDDAAEMHRRGYARNPLVVIHRGPEQTDHLELLFSLHARFGPLKGFDDDLATGARAMGRPAIQYCVARAYERAGQRLLARGLYQTAFLTTPDNVKAHTDAGQLLLRLGAADEAEGQYQAALRAPGGANGLGAIEAQLQLAMIAGRHGDDFAAAERMRRVLEGPLPAGGRLEWTARGKVAGGDEARARLEAEMHWRYFRAARAKHDANSVKAHVKELLRLKPDSPEIALDVVPGLVEQGRAEDATTLFAAPYESGKADLAAHPGDPRRMNSIAWLCVRCGQHLDEALRLAEGAVALDPDNPALLDTAAEANFRLGKAERAVKLESRAVELRPEDSFLREQLQKFGGAKGEAK